MAILDCRLVFERADWKLGARAWDFRMNSLCRVLIALFLWAAPHVRILVFSVGVANSSQKSSNLSPVVTLNGKNLRGWAGAGVSRERVSICITELLCFKYSTLHFNFARVSWSRNCLTISGKWLSNLQLSRKKGGWLAMLSTWRYRDLTDFW